ncbi:MAG TPA: hypothetical protein VF647_15180 [Longimicrobium sp.]|jgi:hypothetical protein
MAPLIRHSRALAALLLTGLIAPAAASAQTAADTTTLVRATADRIREGIRSRSPAALRHYYLGEPTTDFDRWVTLRLQEENALPFLEAQADTADWVVTRGAEFRGDTAAVIFEFGDRRRPADRGGIQTGIDTWRIFFVRSAAGWEFARQVHVSTADIGEVRG